MKKKINYLIAAMLDLQLFADPTPVNKTTDTTATTGNDLSPEMKTFYDRVLIKEASPNLVHAQFGQKKPIPKNGGKTIEFRKFAPLVKATAPLTEGVTPQGKQLDVSTITATVAQYGDYIVQSDMLELTAIDNTIVEATKLLGQQAGLTLDTIVRNVLLSGTYVKFCPKINASTGAETAVTQRSALDATSVLTADMIRQAVATLRAANAPTIDGKYIAIIHPYIAYDLMKSAGGEWIDVMKYAKPDALLSGEIGTFAGVRFVETSEAKIYRNASETSGGETGVTDCPSGLSVFATLFLGANAYGDTEIEGGGLETIVKQKGSGGTGDPLNQRSSVGWKATKTAEILVPQYIIRVESCSPRYSANTPHN